jgi:integrase
MEREIRLEFSLRLSESAKTGISDRQREDHLAFDLEASGVPHFPIYNLRHAFCTRLSWVAPDAVIERAMSHTSPETKRIYQLSMVEQVREAMEKANQKVYGGRVTVH